MKTKSTLLLLLTTLAAATLRAEDQKNQPTPAAPSYHAEQAIDKQLHLLDRPWRNNRVRLSSRLDLPAAVKPGGPPPYNQQVEKAQASSASGPATP